MLSFVFWRRTSGEYLFYNFVFLLYLFTVQIGQPGDGPIYNVTVENLTAENTGDDSVAFFNVVGGGVIKNCMIKDSFARGILLRNSPSTRLINNTLVRCHVLYKNSSLVQSIIHLLNTFISKLLWH